jgi:spartin
MLLTTLESSAHHLISHTTIAMGAAAGHKYGSDAERAVNTMGESVRNVGVVYIDVRGVGRRALLRVAGKRVLKARLGGRDVVFEGQ